LRHHFFDDLAQKDLTPDLDVARRSANTDASSRSAVAEVRAITLSAFIALLLVVLSIAQAEKNDRQWGNFAARHHCVDTGHRNAVLGADFGKREWVCRNGESYWRH
jgi:hypothetical protein